MLKKSEISYSDFSIMSTYMQSNQANNFGFSTEMDNNEPANFPTNRIFMGNLASELEEFTIYRYCSAYGEITKCQIMKEPKTDRSRGSP
jgi:RNA recognition motif-containing protein